MKQVKTWNEPTLTKYERADVAIMNNKTAAVADTLGGSQ